MLINDYLPIKITMNLNLSMTCAAGLESILKKEIELAGYKVVG
jgi:23S rRNA G2445 N2-methylase RlmL